MARKILIGLAILLVGMGIIYAQDVTPNLEIWNKSQIFNPNPSFDTTPVTVKVVSVVYRIPRNYLILMEPAIPTLKLTWPGLTPLTEETRKCFGSISQSERVGCTSVEFRLMGSGAPGSRTFTTSERFDNFMRGKKTTLRNGPSGFVVYAIGPEEARIESYRRTEDDIYFQCVTSDAGNHRRVTLCDDLFRLNDGNHVQFRFRPNLIEHIPEIEANIRQLMASFVTPEGQR